MRRVTVLVRDGSKFKKQGVRIVAGDATKLDDVLYAVQVDAMIMMGYGKTEPKQMLVFGKI